MTELDLYSGREHAAVKHYILQSYLLRLVMILGHNRREICYVDTFAGPWGSDDVELRGTSVGLAAEVLERARQGLAKKGRNVRFRALFIEQEGRAYERLSAFVKRGYGQIAMDCRQGDFLALRDEVLNWAGNDAFTFFFIDPFGWTPVEPRILAPFLARPHSECLINFMYDSFNRVVTQSTFAEHVRSYIGDGACFDGLSPRQRQLEMVRLYRQRLKDEREVLAPGTKTWTAAFPVQDRKFNRVKYHLVYVTSHPLGLVVFGECADNARQTQGQIHAKLREQHRESMSGVVDMFGGGPVEEDVSHRNGIAEAETYWRSAIAVGSIYADQEALADAIEATGAPPSCHQAALGRLIDEGLVINRDAVRVRRTNPVQFKKGERLALIR